MKAVFSRRSDGVRKAAIPVGEPVDDEGSEPGDGRVETGEFVHECPTCEEVYLSDGPRRCSTCSETTVSVVAPAID